MSKKFYVYHHVSFDGLFQYIGKGCGNRAWRRDGRSLIWRKSFGESYKVNLLHENLDEQNSFELERDEISKRKLDQNCILINICAGGYGGDTRNWDEHSRKRLSEMRKGEQSYWFGREKDPAMIAKMKETKRLNPQEPYWKGKKRDPELMKMLAEKAHSPEAMAKSHQTRLANGSYEWTEERRQAVSEKLTGRSRGPEFAAKVSASKKGKPNGRLGSKVSEETKAKMSQAAMGRVLSEESQAKRLATWKARGSTSRKAKKVRCIETGEVFRSSKEAAEALTDGKGTKVIQQCCVGSKPSYRGYRWEHVKEV